MGISFMYCSKSLVVVGGPKGSRAEYIAKFGDSCGMSTEFSLYCVKSDFKLS